MLVSIGVEAGAEEAGAVVAAPPQAVRLSMAAAAIPATERVVRLMVCISVSPLLCRSLPAALLPLWPLSDLSGTDPWLVSQWVFAGFGGNGWVRDGKFFSQVPSDGLTGLNRVAVKQKSPGPKTGTPYCVRKGGLEPPRPKAQEPKSCVSANFTTRARRPHLAGPRTGVADARLHCTFHGTRFGDRFRRETRHRPPPSGRPDHDWPIMASTAATMMCSSEPARS